MGLFDMFAPQEPPKPEFYGPPPSMYTPPPAPSIPEAELKAQQTESLVSPSLVSPVLSQPYQNVMESPSSGLSLEDDLKRKTQKPTGGFAV